jgi:hypothetical protein
MDKQFFIRVNVFLNELKENQFLSSFTYSFVYPFFVFLFSTFFLNIFHSLPFPLFLHFANFSLLALCFPHWLLTIVKIVNAVGEKYMAQERDEIEHRVDTLLAASGVP